jgi:hypothetical protein
MDDGSPAQPQHPDHDLLADFAAQTVLNPELSARIDAHVRRCPHCANLLAEAEAVHAALRAMPPEPMPDDVSRRIEQALAAEFTATRSTSSTASTSSPATSELPTRRSLRTGQLPASAAPSPISPSPSPVAPSPIAPSPMPPARTAPATGSLPLTGRIRIGGERQAQPSRLRRMSTSRQSSRRQSLEEQKSDRPALKGPLLRIAAGLAAVLVVGTGAFQFLSRPQSSPSAQEASSAGALPVVAPVVSTGTNYEKARLATQVKALISTAQAYTQADAQADPKAESSRSSANALGGQSPAGASGDLLRSDAALRNCLAAIGEPGAQPVAVDLARYGGRDAAILVIPATSGEYNVWVVARDCSAQRDGTLDYVVIPA